MIVFVSYARRDNSVATLQVIEQIVAGLGLPYIDDVHGYEAPDRRAAVEAALHEAGIFVGVSTPNYMRTPWTRHEFSVAVRRGIPILALLPNRRLTKPTDPDWPWPGGPVACTWELPTQAAR